LPIDWDASAALPIGSSFLVLQIAMFRGRIQMMFHVAALQEWGGDLSSSLSAFGGRDDEECAFF
jgi:hypothetical protein